MKIKRVEHIAIAVSDLEGMSGMLEDMFGLKCKYTEDFPNSSTRIAMIPVGETCLELLDGYKPEARAAQWLTEKGQSLFHLCLEVDDIDAALTELKEKKVKLIHEQPVIGHGGCRVAFIDPSGTGNILFELMETPDSHA
ncbi:hypothetical protein AWV79_21560 [Cupriavidus sp. UYMMa02A]|nr:hypothetical protein AWV79_21560 [Cupriavidus sp. UYMMa02A]